MGIVSYIPLQAEINKFLNGQIDPLPLVLPSQQLNLLHNMNAPPDLQIRAVHVPNDSGEGGRVQPAGLEVPQEPRHRPPPQIRRVQLRPHGPAAGGEEAVPVGLDLAAVGEAEPRRDVGPGELPEDAAAAEALKTPALLLLEAGDGAPCHLHRRVRIVECRQHRRRRRRRRCGWDGGGGVAEELPHLATAVPGWRRERGIGEASEKIYCRTRGVWLLVGTGN